MKLSNLFTKTLREAPADEEAINAKLLIRGGFVFKNSAGIYSFLPLGWRVLSKIANMIREEMNAIGGQELLMPALVEKKYMEPTARWDLDVGYFAKLKEEKESNFVLGWSHEEVLTSIASKFISSYKDLPFYAYQIQTKFRHEARAKSGLLRGREFMMKDLYSFHVDENDLNKYYEKVAKSYHKIFERCGLKAIYTLAAGGVFTDKFTHEFQVIADVGEDTIYVCNKCEYAENKEISKFKGGDKCSKCGEGKIEEKKSIEVGNIFNQGTKYSEALGLQFSDESGNKKPVIMGAYGIGLSRLMATAVEVYNDDRGIIWPENIAPFKIHLVVLDGKSKEADKVYSDLTKAGIEVLYDDRGDKTPGEKFADADLIGCPIRLVISNKTLTQDSVELKRRNQKDFKLIKLTEIVKSI
ncbi:MAG: aminoacyl--tRNA ligase-related protein [bacterium]|nr:aminoacyl--tRNA ligase-related protein [bacterium]